jgi:hypothetical protein
MNWGQAPVKSGVPPSLDRKSSPWRVRYWGAAETADAPSLPQLLNPGNDAHYSNFSIFHPKQFSARYLIS